MVVLGRPSLPDAGEVSAVVHAAKREIRDLVALPSLVMVEGSPQGVLPPHWQHQLTWSDGTRLARVGHQYLSVHFVRRADREKYETYETSLLPDLRRWLELLGAVIARAPEAYPLDRVVFGYVNTFEFAGSGFDISRYFKANIGLDIAIAQDGLRGLDAKFRMSAGCVNEVTLGLKVDTSDVEVDGATQPRVDVVTKTVAQELAFDLTAFHADRIVEKASAAKDRAKWVFFDFATEETHRLMGAMP